MKSGVQLVLVAVAGVVLAVGVFLGVRPVTVTLTLVSPELKELTVPCGIGFLPGVPDAGAGELVRLRTGELVPRSGYAENCAAAAGWWPYLAWGLTGVGVAGLALFFVGRRNRVDAGPAS